MKKLLLVACIALSVVANAQTVNSKLSFQKGQKFEVYTQMNRTSQQEMMGRQMESSFTNAFTSVYDVSDVNNDGANISASTKRIKFDASFFGREENFDSDNPEDMKSEMGKMMAKPLNAKYSMVVDASGAITAVKEEDTQNGKKSRGNQAEGMMSMFMGGMNASAAPKAGDPSLFKVLPNKPVAKGDSWNDEIKDGNGTRKISYTISNITDKDILIDFNEDAKMVVKQEMMGQQAAISVKSKSNGRIVLDKATGILKQKTFVTTSEEDINAAGMQMPSKSKMTTTITVKPI